MKRLTILFLALLTFCSSPEPPTPTPLPLPTVMIAAEVPTAIPVYDSHVGLEDMVNEVLANGAFRVIGIYAEEYTQEELNGRLLYDVELVATSPNIIKRSDVLWTLYILQREFYYNTELIAPVSFRTVVFATETGQDSNCSLSAGIGAESVSVYLPESQPQDIEGWYKLLVDNKYYGDLEGETRMKSAFGNDARSRPLCELDNWK